MAPPPTQIDFFFARYQTPILMGAFATQICHHQYIKRTEPSIASSVKGAVRATNFPRTLRAGLGWGVVFLGLLTEITLAKQTIRDHTDPVLAQSLQKKWKRTSEAFQLNIPTPCPNNPTNDSRTTRTMSADFWAGYISGAAGIIIGNPLDVLKVRLQAGTGAPSTPSPTSQFSSAGSLIRGATAPILGYGALNALLFVTYNRTSAFLNTNPAGTPAGLWSTWLAGAIGGLATWVVSTPTELVKCRAQLSTSSSWNITKEIMRAEGVRGMYFGGAVTALRDSVGYGFYFWSYELSTRLMMSRSKQSTSSGQEAAKVLLCGGLAGVVTWASVFPLDVVKTRVQTQVNIFRNAAESEALLGANGTSAETSPALSKRLGAVEIARNAYRAEGAGVFFRGLAVCSVRAFVVNAAQWAVYEWVMRELDPERKAGMRNDIPS
ncbi:Mitochondrial basic amino acids transporter [Lachnellula hyalina]|uniref:Mitochondrial basic amino acids transporter n=1 Tax=Lachnellula hyalina TaxID=1316788 RepID=A0A8H8U437_9HELO|nr:Mitochondrial basic amino acids transporter [Lachnellula hyalina]TVY30928.1 Mitochondrial basic amino acids transporter [Lachnellula hyalina]